MPRRAKSSETSRASSENERARRAKNAKRAKQRSLPEKPAPMAVVGPVEMNPSQPKRFEQGGPGGPGRKPGKTLLSRVREMLAQNIFQDDGTLKLDPVTGEPVTHFDAAAKAFVRSMKKGSFVHLKEFIEREEGKVAQRVEGLSENQIKVYVNMPTEGDEAP